MADTQKLTALQNLAASLPVANSRIASGQKAARDIQMQRALGGQQVIPNNTATAQQVGASQAETAGTQAVQNAQQGIAQLGQIGNLGRAETARQNQSDVFGLQQGAKQQELDNVQKLASISEDAKKQLYDDQMQFQKDELGRTQFNTIQLADFARTSAQNEEQYKNYAQQAQQLTQKNLQVMETAYQKIAQDLEFQYDTAKQSGDQQEMEAVARRKQEYEQKMQREKAKASNNAAAWQAGGTILGGAVGALGGPVGAIAGAALGSAAGGLAGTQLGGK